MAPEAPTPVPMAVTAEVEVVSHLNVRVEGPGGLVARIHIPDAEEAYDALQFFVAGLPQAVEEAMARAEAEIEEAERG